MRHDNSARVCQAYVINLICIRRLNCDYGTVFIAPEQFWARVASYLPVTHLFPLWLSITLEKIRWIVFRPSVIPQVLSDQRVPLSKNVFTRRGSPQQSTSSSPSSSSSAATGPNPPAGRPLQGPGVHRRDPPMDGTWPIERGGTATSSKCRRGVRGER